MIGDSGLVAPAAAETLLRVEDLHVNFATDAANIQAVEGLSLEVKAGEIVALVGESGSGKSVSAHSIMRLLPRTGRIPQGRILFEGRNLLDIPEEKMRHVRGKEISMIFQEPMTSLNPVLPIGLQLIEPLQVHLRMSARQANARAVELLRLVGISDAEQRLHQYPHQFSGGMRQRVMIAIGLACDPKLIIADEPTTALDVTIQAQILELMKSLSRDLGIALIIITHNLGIVARYAHRVVVMYAGRVVEQGEADAIFHRPRHPYTMGLLRSVPRLDRPRGGQLATIEGLPPSLADTPRGCRFAPRCPFRLPACEASPPLVPTDAGGLSACIRVAEISAGKLAWHAATATPLHQTNDANSDATIVSIRNLTKYFPVKTGLLAKPRAVRAVEDVSFDIRRGETLGLVGESGCGKSTVGRLILRLEQPTRGSIAFQGRRFAETGRSEFKAIRRKIQAVFQDPYSSLNPRMTTGQIIAEPLKVYGLVADGAAVDDRVTQLLKEVGLRPEIGDRYPHQLSGGQRQRVGIARALAIEPEFIVCDEAVSALDVSIQGQIVNLLETLQRKRGLSYLFIAHDLAVVRHISSRIVVMYLGRVMETADRDELCEQPLHPYTKLLLEAAPIPDPTAEKARAPRLIQGELPSPLSPPSGCVFHTRCPMASIECKAEVPALREAKPGHAVACIKV
ncbi:ABC transporter ATP-binding protein [Pseudorhodoplanes sinuspersici]|uniref:dipeptide ABC transporter ATP-binding protein n=1 Tax=Pseudorhodoplanes sinuspersici TaxID=1235591 RepID=UPI00247808D0|nr:ABC transporter ATP-binding protein [Pseudorhodoplanes sinuspersici]